MLKTYLVSSNGIIVAEVAAEWYVFDNDNVVFMSGDTVVCTFFNLPAVCVGEVCDD